MIINFWSGDWSLRHIFFLAPRREYPTCSNRILLYSARHKSTAAPQKEHTLHPTCLAIVEVLRVVCCRSSLTTVCRLLVVFVLGQAVPTQPPRQGHPFPSSFGQERAGTWPDITLRFVSTLQYSCIVGHLTVRHVTLREPFGHCTALGLFYGSASLEGVTTIILSHTVSVSTEVKSLTLKAESECLFVNTFKYCLPRSWCKRYFLPRLTLG